MTVFSICIPRVFKNISENRIRAVFNNLHLGTIERIDMAPKSNEKGDDFWCVFIHFSVWFDTANANQVRSKLENGERVKVVYDEPWYWLISMSTSVVKQRRSAPYIDLSHSRPVVHKSCMGIPQLYDDCLTTADFDNIDAYFGDDILDEIDNGHMFNATLTHFEQSVIDKQLLQEEKDELRSH
jgi:hypothetical protein